ncbi:hypothetical protein [Kitasatospora sp. DSM 101779]|uniref:hypothetical protein n=1 Tax=Kitasatospora sp. DSM 101779 TaxID=2853165 RepID=UPI0021D8F444|nr:hypothetical protein [Kitasatospora sp. DSM 101779]MCU7826673.1 hypothetical protein [Kitasatospora sp. DSM 101779]
MGEIVTAAVAVVGTLLGAGLTSFWQFRLADRTERSGRDGYIRSQRVEAYSGFAAAMAELSRAQLNRWHRRLDLPEQDPEPARALVFECRSTARQALFRVLLVAGSDRVKEAARAAFESHWPIGDARDEAESAQLSAACRQAVEAFLAQAAQEIA